MKRSLVLAAALVMTAVGCGDDPAPTTAEPAPATSTAPGAPAPSEPTGDPLDVPESELSTEPVSVSAEQLAADLGCDLQLTSDPAPDTEKEYDCGALRIVDFTDTSISTEELQQVAPTYATGAGETSTVVGERLLLVGDPMDIAPP